MIFADLILIAVSSALLSFMYDKCMDEGMIFEKWGDWLEGDQWYKSMIGGCIYCTSVYISILMYCVFSFFPVIWGVAFTISLAFFLVHLLVKLG